MREVDIDIQPGETVSEYAYRMIELVEWIAALVRLEAGWAVDADDMLDDVRFIVAQVGNPDWPKWWELRQQIDRITGRMTDVGQLERVLVYVTDLQS